MLRSMQGDMKNIFNADFIAKHGKPDVLVTDPPRDGMHGDVIALACSSLKFLESFT